MPQNSDWTEKAQSHFFERAVAQAELARDRNENADDPAVGAVIVDTSQPPDETAIVAEAARSGIYAGEHAEFAALERFAASLDLSRGHYRLYTTLEPCTERGPGKVACANRVLKRGLRDVSIGMLDPNPNIWGKGVHELLAHDAEVTYFPGEYRRRIEDLNEDFIHSQTTWEEDQFREKLPHAFVEPDQPYSDAAYALFRKWESNVLIFNTDLQMLAREHEFQAWWTNGLLNNPKLKVQIVVRDRIRRRVLREDLRRPFVEAELQAIREREKEIMLGSHDFGQDDQPAMFFWDKTDDRGWPIFEYGLMKVRAFSRAHDHDAEPTKRMVLVANRKSGKGWDRVLDRKRDAVVNVIGWPLKNLEPLQP